MHALTTQYVSVYLDGYEAGLSIPLPGKGPTKLLTAPTEVEWEGKRPQKGRQNRQRPPPKP